MPTRLTFPVKVSKSHRITPQKAPSLYGEGISVVTVTNRPSYIFNVYNNFLRQTYHPRELIIILNNNSMNIENWRQQAPPYESIKIFQLDEEVSLGECYNYAVARTSYKYVAKFDDDDYYAADFISTGMKTFARVNAHIVGKSCRFIYFESSSTLALHEPFPEHSYVEYVPGATMIIKKKVFDKVRFPDLNAGEDSAFQEECLQQGFLIYANDCFNYVTIRRQDKDTHTFKLDDETYMGYCNKLITTKDFRPLITRADE
jgi:GT2 family glycosyltransferase